MLPILLIPVNLLIIYLVTVFSDVQGFVNPPSVRGKGQKGKGQGKDFTVTQDLGKSCWIPDPKIEKSGNFCLDKSLKNLSAPRIRVWLCSIFVRTLDQAFNR